MSLTKPGEKRCAFPDCPRPVEDDDECCGCGYFICEFHSANPGVMGKHDVTEHWEGEDEEEYD